MIFIATIKIKGAVCKYGSHAIMHYFTASEIITEPKVYMILRYFLKMVRNMHGLVHGQLGRPQKYSTT